LIQKVVREEKFYTFSTFLSREKFKLSYLISITHDDLG